MTRWPRRSTASPSTSFRRALKEPLEWNNSHLIKGDVAEGIAKLKAQPGKDLQVIGSGDLAQTLMEHDLVDVYRLMVHPIVLGSGRRLFRDGSATTALRLVDSTTTGTGVLIPVHLPASRRGPSCLSCKP